MNKTTKTVNTLTATTEVPIRFNEVDSLKVVWHGHYYRYFEDAREAFGKEYDIDYLTVYEQGIVIPIVESSCEHKRPLNYGDTAIIEITFHDLPAAKIRFTYKVYRKSDGKLSAKGATTQVFLNLDGELLLNIPPFINSWRKKWNLI